MVIVCSVLQFLVSSSLWQTANNELTFAIYFIYRKGIITSRQKHIFLLFLFVSLNEFRYNNKYKKH